MSAADDRRELGSFPVQAHESEVAAFRLAAGLDAADDTVLPLTYPMRWLASPPVRAALLALVEEADVVPFHEAQTFAYDRSLHVAERYHLVLAARRERDPDRLVVDGTILGNETAGAPAAVEHATLEMILRLFPMGSAS